MDIGSAAGRKPSVQPTLDNITVQQKQGVESMLFYCWNNIDSIQRLVLAGWLLF